MTEGIKGMFFQHKPTEMPKISEGVFVGQTYPWGSVYGSVRRSFQFEKIVEYHLTYRSVCTVPLQEAYGFSVVSAEFDSNHQSRPVMRVAYEISDEASKESISTTTIIFVKHWRSILGNLYPGGRCLSRLYRITGPRCANLKCAIRQSGKTEM